jgi:outer membrane protein OmpA-like peptidoglycan-associated protein
LGYSPLFAGIQTRLGENVVLNTYGGFSLSFSDSLDGRARGDQELNSITNKKQDGYWFWEAGLQFGFPGRKNKTESKNSEDDFPLAEVETVNKQPDAPVSEPPFGFESSITDSLPQSDAPITLTVPVASDMSDNLYRTIGFAFGGSSLSSEAIYVLRVVADSLKNNPSVRLRIVGHADNQGSPQGIEKVAMARAIAVRDWLINNGISQDRLETSSAGAREPRADNNTHEGRLANRRVELWVIN